MRLWISTFALLAVLGTSACTRAERDSAAREAGREAHEAKQDTKRAADKIEDGADTAARKAGKAAHEIAQESKEAAAKAGRALKRATKEAKEGWNEAARESRTERKK
jgi:hypothetical protein